MLAEALRSLLFRLGDRGALRLRRPPPPPGMPGSDSSVSINTLLRSLTPAQLKDPAMLRADCASPLPMDATDPAPLDLTESYVVFKSSSASPLWALWILDAAILACSIYLSALEVSFKLKYLRL